MHHQFTRRELLCTLGAAGLVTLCSAPLSTLAIAAQQPSWRQWSSQDVAQAFGRFAQQRRMPEDLAQWLDDPQTQKIAPYKVFDDVYCVGIRWVCAYAIRTTEGVILIDTLHEPFVDHLLDNLKTVGIGLDEIRYVLMTHGHFDHVGGYY